MYKLTHETIHALMMHCLYSKEEHEAAQRAAGANPDDPPKDALCVNGIVRDFGFNPVRIAEKREEIEALLPEVPLEFFPESEGGGGGMSFLRLCLRRDGSQWGEQSMAECLYCLCAAVGHARMLISERVFWVAMPGGVPYMVFSTAVLPATIEA